MTMLEMNIIDSLDAIADNTPLHADELRKCSTRVRALIDEIDQLRQSCREAAVLVKSQQETIDSLRDEMQRTRGGW